MLLGPGDAEAAPSEPREERFEGLLLEIERQGDEVGLLIGPPAGAPITLTLSIGANEPPFQPGERLLFRYFEWFDAPARARRAAIVIRDGTGALRLAFQDGGLLPPDELPEGLAISGARSVVYTEARRLDGLCYAVIEHRALSAAPGQGGVPLIPGRAGQVVSTPRGQFRIVAVDNAVTRRTDCGYTPSRMSWLALRIP